MQNTDAGQRACLVPELVFEYSHASEPAQLAATIYDGSLTHVLDAALLLSPVQGDQR